MHPENIYAKLVTKEVLKFSKLSVVKVLLPLNKYSIVSTLHVLKFLISNDCKEEQSENILFNEVILVVSKLETSIEISDSHPSNIWCINKTLEVSKFDIFKCFNDFK